MEGKPRGRGRTLKCSLTKGWSSTAAETLSPAVLEWPAAGSDHWQDVPVDYSGRLWIRTADGDELRLLLAWLRRDDGLRGRVHAADAAVELGEMGGAIDAIAVAVGSGSMGAVLAKSLSTWLVSRRSDIKVTLSNGDGRSIEVDAKRVDPHVVLQNLRDLLGDSESSL
ncbi:effector-associated constant component EACC1 [Nocardia sp. CA-084685]|uniref:effector-associated constant component EACC1 n=1 Tax=Nocardia sp. CA-084685 TaxID=3239970 RepID=UPI003D9651F4